MNAFDMDMTTYSIHFNPNPTVPDLLNSKFIIMTLTTIVVSIEVTIVATQKWALPPLVPNGRTARAAARPEAKRGILNGSILGQYFCVNMLKAWKGKEPNFEFILTNFHIFEHRLVDFSGASSSALRDTGAALAQGQRGVASLEPKKKRR